MALVRAAHHLADERFSFVVGHVNHKLRGRESEGDARFVRALAKEIEFPYMEAAAPVRPLRKGNLEETAREKRYAALEKMARRYRCDAILTAHTQDDQVETVLMNLLRGTGTDGLAGIPPARAGLGGGTTVLRPFLAISKTELIQFLRRSNTRFRKDRTNRDQTLLRNWMRAKLVPELEKKSPGFKNRIARLADVAREEKRFWEPFLRRMKDELMTPNRGGAILDFRGLLSYPAAAQRRFLRSATGGDLLGYEAVEKLRRWMSAPPTGGRLWQLRRGWTVERLSKSKGSPSAALFLFKNQAVNKGNRK